MSTKTFYNKSSDVPYEYCLCVPEKLDIKAIFSDIPKDAKTVVVHDAQKRGRWDYLVEHVCKRYGYAYYKCFDKSGDYIWRIVI